jgi:ubiquitin-protein ligase
MDLNQMMNINIIESFVDILNRLVSNNYKINDKKIISNILKNKDIILTYCDENNIKILFNNFFVIFDNYKLINTEDTFDNNKIIDEFILKKYQYMIIENNLSNYMDKKSFIQITNKSYNTEFNKKHLMKELLMLKNSLPCNNESGIYLCYNMDDISKLKVLIIPSESTPYAYGCFIFNIHICNNYPNNPPLVKLITTGNGTVRFNPNLYNCGKVCLSLLGTWSGNTSETWIPNQSTLLQVLISIQSLIFVDDPYYNEPGYQTRSRIEESKKYNENIQINNIKYAIIENIMNPDKDFKDLIFNHFKLNKIKIINKVEKWLNEAQEKSIIDTKIQIINKLMTTFNKNNI